MLKSRRPPIWASCRDKDGTGSGISRVYLWADQWLGPSLGFWSYPSFSKKCPSKMGLRWSRMGYNCKKWSNNMVIFLPCQKRISKWWAWRVLAKGRELNSAATLGWGLLVGLAAESCSQIWLPCLRKALPIGESWGMANDGEWRTGQYLVEEVKVIKCFHPRMLTPPMARVNTN